MLRRRQQLAGRTLKELNLCEYMAGFNVYAEARNIAYYVPIKGEPSLQTLFFDPDKVSLFPKVAGDRLDFFVACSEFDFEAGSFGIMEPSGSQAVAVTDIDLILVPGVTFDRRGYRIGYGKGFYDRLMAQHADVATCGVCFDELLVDECPHDPWDQRVDYLVSDKGIFKSSK